MQSLIVRGVVIACLAASLGACGGGGSGTSPTVAANGGAASNTGAGTSGNGTGTAASGGSFVAAVLSLLGSSSDTASPVSIDAYDAASSDTALPQPIS